ncbi:MAG: hypothetical protein HY537_00525 [Deltaproteobacteria bacterium]|nr:hypothetical protein [Deltaproteobacteria bacterium]
MRILFKILKNKFQLVLMIFLVASVHCEVGKAEFTVKPVELQSHVLKLPPNRQGETLTAYLKRAEVSKVIAVRLGRPDARPEEITKGEAVSAIGTDVEGVTTQQVSNAWHHLSNEIRSAIGTKKSPSLDFRIISHQQESTVALPLPLPGQGLTTYFGRSDVQKVIAARLGRSDARPEEITPGDALSAVGEDIEGVTTRQVYSAWSYVTHKARIASGVKTTNKLLAWTIKRQNEQSGTIKLPSNNAYEGLQTYLRRADVQKAVALRLGRRDALPEEITPGDAVSAIGRDIEGCEVKQIHAAWSSLTAQIRAASGTKRINASSFRIKSQDEQFSPIRLPTNSEGEGLQPYFRRKDVQEVIAARLGRPDAHPEEITAKDVAGAIGADIDGLTAGQISRAWSDMTADIRAASGTRTMPFIFFKVPSQEQQSNPIKLPPNHENKGLQAYLRREDVQAAIIARLGRPDAHPEEITAKDVAGAIGADIEDVTTAQLSSAWKEFVGEIRSASETKRYPPPRSYFQVKKPQEQDGGIKLPINNENEGLQTYFRRADVQEVIAARLGRPDARPEEITKGDATSAVGTDIVGVSTIQLSNAWGTVTTDIRVASGTRKRTQTAIFRVKEKHLQSNVISLPYNYRGEGLTTYFRRVDVQRVIAARLGRPDASPEKIFPSDAVFAVGTDIEGVTAEQLSSGWHHLTFDIRTASGTEASPMLVFQVKSHDEEPSILTLPTHSEGEGLQAYLRREDVQKAIVARLGRPDASPEEIAPADAVSAIGKDVDGVTTEQLSSAWQRISKELRAASGTPGSSTIVFEVKSRSEQTSNIALPSKRGCERLTSYLRRSEVQEVIALRLGRPDARPEDITSRDAVFAIGTDIQGATPSQLSTAWNSVATEIRTATGRLKRSPVVIFRIKNPNEQSGEIALPAHNEVEGLTTYFRRAEVQRAIAARLVAARARR